MIVKSHFTPWSMVRYVRGELALGAVAGLVAWGLVDVAGLKQLVLPIAVATVLGTALGILLAVRANTSYARWWEASGVWAEITGLSRNLMRVVVAVSESKGLDASQTREFQTDIGRRQIAFAHAVRADLRGEARSEALRWMSEDERPDARSADNLPLIILELQSRRIFRGFDQGMVAGLENFQMEVALAGLARQQALAERLATQPTPRTYSIFSRYFVHIFVVVFPFALLDVVSERAWVVIPATLIVAFAFRMAEQIGAVVERPFGGTIQDVPMSSICIDLERDILELAGVKERPPPPRPVAGYLW